MARWTAGKQDCGQAGVRAGLQASLCLPIRFIYCTIPLLLHYYVDRRMYCTTDLYLSNSISLNPCPIADTFIWSFAVVNQYDSTTAQQQTSVALKLCVFPICVELLSWLSGSVYHHFCKPLVRWVCKQVRKCLLKITFPYWYKRILAVIGTYWHRIDTITCASEERKFGFRSLRPQTQVRLVHRPYSRSSFGQHRHRETMLWEQE